MPKIRGKPQKPGGERGGDSPWLVLRRNLPCRQLNLRLLAPRTKRQCISVLQVTQSAVFRYGSPCKPTVPQSVSFLRVEVEV